MRDYQQELENRVAFIRKTLEESRAKGIVFGNSGGKDCALVGILCKKACDNTVGIMMPCQSKQNFGSDMDDGNALVEKFGIESKVIDLSKIKELMQEAVGGITELNGSAVTNIAPRLRMTALYTYGAANSMLVAGTGNRSERYMGYFTKWGDGGFDFNPISDLTVGEVYEFLEFLGAPRSIIEKAPSAGLFEGQTDEKEMGVTYAAVDRYILTGEAEENDKKIIERYYNASRHKRRLPTVYKDMGD